MNALDQYDLIIRLAKTMEQSMLHTLLVEWKQNHIRSLHTEYVIDNRALKTIPETEINKFAKQQLFGQAAKELENVIYVDKSKHRPFDTTFHITVDLVLNKKEI